MRPVRGSPMQRTHRGGRVLAPCVRGWRVTTTMSAENSTPMRRLSALRSALSPTCTAHVAAESVLPPPPAFAADYAEARSQLHRWCKTLGGQLTQYFHPLPGPHGEKLSTDVVCLGPPDASKCLITFSAVHGLEGLAGSAAQMAWLASPQAKALPAGVKVIVVHAVNCWGYAWRSRLTEDGVDLNRNFVDHKSPPRNERYERYRNLTPVVDVSQAGIDAFREGLRRAGEDLDPVARSSGSNGGQYHDPKGITFGGQAPCWSNTTINQLVREHAGHASKVVVIDWHTGVGAYNDVAYLFMHPFGDPLQDMTEKWWGGKQINEWTKAPFDEVLDQNAGTTGWHTANGSHYGQLRFALAQEMLPHSVVTGALIEFGCFGPDTPTSLGGHSFLDNHL